MEKATATGTDRRALRIVRVEQQLGRRLLFAGETSAQCAICGEEFPPNLLVAAHIKQRAECDDSERKDLENILMANCPTCDALYERGYLSISSGGHVITAGNSSYPPGFKGLLQTISGKKCSAFSPDSEGYFEWHRNNRFLEGG